MQTLLIYDLVPESQKRVLIPDAPDWLVEVDGLLAGADELTERQEELLQWVGDAMASELKHCANPMDTLATTWSGLDLPSAAVIEGPVRVIHCGFVL